MKNPIFVEIITKIIRLEAGRRKKGQKKSGRGRNRASYPRARSKRLSNGFDVALTCIFRHVGFEFQLEPEPIRSKPLRNGQPTQGRSLRQSSCCAVQRVGGNVVVLQRVSGKDRHGSMTIPHCLSLDSDNERLWKSLLA